MCGKTDHIRECYLSVNEHTLFGKTNTQDNTKVGVICAKHLTTLIESVTKKTIKF